MTIDEIRAQFVETRAMIGALPDTGAVLFNWTSCLAIKLPDGDAARGFVTGLQHAHIFSEADSHQPPAKVPGLDRRYSDGADKPFMLTGIKVAKKMAIAKLDAAIAALPMVDDIKS